jgi:hypothetical protein
VLPVGGDTPITFFLCVFTALAVTYFGMVLLKKGAVEPVKNEEEEADI